MAKIKINEIAGYRKYWELNRRDLNVGKLADFVQAVDAADASLRAQTEEACGSPRA